MERLRRTEDAGAGAQRREEPGAGEHANEVLDAALRYYDLGLSVIPVRADGTKGPALRRWSQYQSVRAQPDQLRRWFERSDYGLAIVCGEASGGLEVLDFDEAGLFDTFASVCREQGIGEVVARCHRVTTPSSGAHLYYRLAGPVPPGRTLAARVDAGRQSGGVRIETRGEGHYVIAPPSGGRVHPSGRPYQGEERALRRSIPVLTERESHCLIEAARVFDDRPVREAVGSASPSRATTGSRAGDLYNQTDQYEDILRRHGWVCLKTHGKSRSWRRPGKQGRATSATTNCAGHRGMHVFSTNASPFEANRWYQPFAVYALLEHGGDFRAAARELGCSGEPTPPGPHVRREVTVAPALLAYIDSLITQGRLRPIDKSVFKALSQYTNCQNETFVGQERIGKDVGCSRCWVNASMARLAHAQMLDKRPRPGVRFSKLYVLRAAPPREWALANCDADGQAMGSADASAAPDTRDLGPSPSRGS
jgi:hypothetical protein